MKPGEQAPDFELPDQEGNPRKLSELLKSGPVVLFFYPLASSGGCTTEACHFRDLAAEFAEVKAQPVGISADSVQKQAQFATSNSFEYPLLSDSDGAVSKQFGTRRALGPLKTRRRTFVIDTDRTVLQMIKSELKFEYHADEALKVLRERTAA